MEMIFIMFYNLNTKYRISINMALLFTIRHDRRRTIILFYVKSSSL